MIYRVIIKSWYFYSKVALAKNTAVIAVARTRDFLNCGEKGLLYCQCAVLSNMSFAKNCGLEEFYHAVTLNIQKRAQQSKVFSISTMLICHKW